MWLRSIVPVATPVIVSDGIVLGIYFVINK